MGDVLAASSRDQAANRRFERADAIAIFDSERHRFTVRLQVAAAHFNALRGRCGALEQDRSRAHRNIVVAAHAAGRFQIGAQHRCREHAK